MFNITLISTNHGELGKCNSDELYKIIESINPDVIFEELPAEIFNTVYKVVQHPNEPLEVKAVKRYLLNHKIRHFPVDINPDLNLQTSDIESMFGAFRKYTAFSNIEIELNDLIARDGFVFLNSKRCYELLGKKRLTERKLIEFMINKERLFYTWNYFYSEQENRDNEMLDNIYKFSKEYAYDKAIFTVGVGHRKSLMQKIYEVDKKADFKLNWSFYNT
jgi:hypothetical protein